MVFTRTEHTRSERCHFLRLILSLQLNQVVMVNICTEHTRSGKGRFLRQILLLYLNPVTRVTTCTEHTRSGKCHFLRKILLLQLNPVIRVTACTEHTRSRKYPFLGGGNFSSKLLFSWLQHVVHISGPKIDTFLGVSWYYGLIHASCHGYYIY